MSKTGSVSVIAEVGVNHNGDLRLASDLLEKSVAAGANIVKFQTFDPAELTDESALSAPYQSSTSVSQRDMLEGLSLSHEDFKFLSKLADSLGSEFLTTAFDVNSLRFAIDELGIKRIKIPSGEITNPFLLHYAGESDLPIILSTGMASQEEISRAINIISAGRDGLSLKEYSSSISDSRSIPALDNFTILHCISLYPCPIEELNLSSIQRFNSFAGCKVGLSDHTSSILAPALSVAFGGSVVEKHITLDKTMDGPDHKASIEPHEFREMVSLIREAEILLGSANRELSTSELEMRKFARRGVYALEAISAGELIGINNVRFARPETGLVPSEVLSRNLIANQDLGSGQMIGINDIGTRK